MSSSPSYNQRCYREHCNRYGASKDEPCWGDVFGSSRGLECKGHAGGKYTRELNAEEIEMARQEAERQRLAAAIAKADEDERQRQKWEANRWFRSLIERAPVESTLWWKMLPEPVLKMVFSMIGDGITVGGASQAVITALEEAGLPAIAEVQRRGLDWPVGPYDLELDPNPDLALPKRHRGIYRPFADRDLAFDLTVLSNRELILWYGCAAQVVDYSMLEQGTRQVVSHLWHILEAECERRGLDLVYLFDMETVPSSLE
jgi:hypothetical protein